MTARKILLTPLANIKELLSVINPLYMPEISAVRALLVDSLITTAIESIYYDLYSEPKELTYKDIIEAYEVVLEEASIGIKLHHTGVKVADVLKEIIDIKDQLMYTIAVEGSLVSSTFYVEILNPSILKIIIYDISPIKKMRKGVIV